MEYHGVRPLAHRIRNKGAMEHEQKYHFSAKYISSYIDASPKIMKELQRSLREDENTLRQFSLKVKKPKSDNVVVKKGWRAEMWNKKDANE